MNDGADPDLRQRAANAYVVWPLAVLDVFREPPDATAWSRLHTRQLCARYDMGLSPIREALMPFVSGQSVALPASIWIVTASAS